MKDFKQSHEVLQDMFNKLEAGNAPASDAYTKAEIDQKISNLQTLITELSTALQGKTSMYMTADEPGADSPMGSFWLFGGELKIKDLSGNWVKIELNFD